MKFEEWFVRILNALVFLDLIERSGELFHPFAAIPSVAIAHAISVVMNVLGA